MKSLELHRWNLSPREAIEVQQTLRGQILLEDRIGEVKLVAGTDVGLIGGFAHAAVAVLSYPRLELVEHATASAPLDFPYIPGLLSFREAPAVLAALEKLKLTPDLLLCDGQGIAHPRRFGIACHLGLLTGIPSIGIGKTRLCGIHDQVPNVKGAHVRLEDHGEIIGAVLRTRAGVKPIYVSPGHKVSLETAIGYAMGCVTKYRLPETTRWAHRLASETRAV